MARSHNCQDFKHCEEVYGWPKPELAKWIVLLHETEQKLRKGLREAVIYVLAEFVR